MHILAKPDDEEVTEDSLCSELSIDRQDLFDMLSALELIGAISLGGFAPQAPDLGPQPTEIAGASMFQSSAAATSRRMVLKTASPPWLAAVDLAAMAATRRECRRISRETGVPHEVDHIVPLRGADVCGLNVPWNLRIVSGRINNIKSNRLDESLAASPVAATGAAHNGVLHA